MSEDRAFVARARNRGATVNGWGLLMSRGRMTAHYWRFQKVFDEVEATSLCGLFYVSASDGQTFEAGNFPRCKRCEKSVAKHNGEGT